MPANLSFVIPDAPMDSTSDNITNIKYVMDSYDMLNNGIEALKHLHEATTMLRSTRLAETVAEHSQVVGGFARGVTRLAAAVEVGNILLTYVGMWLDLAGAHAAAMASITKDSILRGLSHGVVLGADGKSHSYVASNFWQNGKQHFPFYPHLDQGAKNLHNVALVSGYAQGSRLSTNQKGRLYADLLGTMTEGSKNLYFGGPGGFGNLGHQTRKDYYIECAALFRKLHLR
ncbi:MAG: hypothetical protein U0133_20705 [Gemmatimonadales bacterium]